MSEAGDHPVTAPARRRRAILVADVVDSVAMMEADEVGVIGRWRAFITTLTESLLPAHGGRLVKSLGDGILAEFPDPAQAVSCAFAMHRDLAVHGESAQSIGIRVGIHIADVFVEDYDVFGDGVNIAARLADLGGSGDTIVTAGVRDCIPAAARAAIEDLGEQRLRNRQRAVRAFRVWPPTALARFDAAPGTRNQGRPAIAVLPFRVLSTEDAHRHLGDGFAEEAVSALSRQADLFVVSRLSSLAFRDHNPGLERIGSALAAQYLVSGCLHGAGPKLILLVELSGVRGGEVLWSGRYEVDGIEPFVGLSRLAQTVVAAIVEIVRERELHSARTGNVHQLDAYGLTLRGFDLMHCPSQEQFLLAKPVLEMAIERNPVAPAPRAWLANWYVFSVATGRSANPSRDAAIAGELTDRALQREPANAQLLAVDALVRGWMNGDLEAAGKQAALAVECNAREPLAWLFQGATWAWREEGAQAVRSVELALSLSPAGPIRYYFCSLAASAHLVAGQYARAIELAKASLLQNPWHTPSLRVLAMALELSGDGEAARRAMRRLMRLEPALTVGGYAARYPGRDSPHGRRFCLALRAAGLPA